MNPEKRLKLRRFGPFSFRMDTLELRRDGVRVRLRPRAARLLSVLLEHQGELVEHDTLRAALWEDRTVEWQDGLHQAVRDVRVALDDTGKPPKLIANVPRRGYKFLDVQPNASAPPRAAVGHRLRYFGLGAVSVPLAFLVVCFLAVAS